jgi:hypothetical protein
MAIVVPVSLLSQDVAGAMLQSNGVGVLVNHNSAPASTALFPQDLIETQKNAAARLVVSGSSADLNAETMVEFDSDELVLDHGALSVHTTRGLRVRIGCLTVTPVNPSDWTQYDVIDVDGKVTVRANQNDVYIDARSKNPQQIKQPERSGRTIVRQGEETSRDEKCGGAYLNTPNAMPGLGAALNSPWAVATGVTVIGVLTCWALCRSGNPASPARP